MKVLLTVLRVAVLSWAGFHLARALGTIDPERAAARRRDRTTA